MACGMLAATSSVVWRGEADRIKRLFGVGELKLSESGCANVSVWLGVSDGWVMMLSAGDGLE